MTGLDRARELIAQGFAVTPLQGKKPILPDWPRRPITSGPDAWATWGEDHPSAGVGIVCGPASGVVVIDVDRLEALDEIAAAGIVLPATRTAQSPRGGKHLFYRLPAGPPMGNHTGALPAGVDVRGEGGQVVAYPASADPIAEMPAALVEMIRAPRAQAGGGGAVTDALARAARRHLAALDSVARLPEGQRTALGWSWESLETVAEWKALADLAVEHDADPMSLLPPGWPAAFRTFLAAKFAGHSSSAVPGLAAVREAFAAGAPSAAGGETRSLADVLGETSDAYMAERCAREALEGQWVHSAGLGWLAWDGRRWQRADDAGITEVVRRWAQDVVTTESARCAGLEPEQARKMLQGYLTLLSRGRIGAIASLARGLVRRDAAEFDAQPDLLNVANGVVDLRTGALLPHDPALLFTKITSRKFTPGLTSADLTAALSAVPPEVADYLQVRLGQAASGHMPADDVMAVLQGIGANGKSTLLETAMSGLGEFAVLLSDRVLLANPSDHPTELMDLRGARLAVIEETPEARRLNVARLKKTVGTPRITARLIRHDDVTFECTHTLFLSTNHLPVVAETDHGTWRRLALVRFPLRYVKAGVPLAGPDDRRGDPQLRTRLKRDPAVLAWIVEGARRWYASGAGAIPEPAAVTAATAAWRGESDLIVGFVADHLTVDPGAHVSAEDLHGAFTSWVEEQGFQPWSARLLSERFRDHESIGGAGVVKARLMPGAAGLSRRHPWAVPPAGKYVAWRGVRFSSGSGQGSDLPERALDTLDRVTPMNGLQMPSREVPGPTLSNVSKPPAKGWPAW